jgi:hypothetical protein
MRLQLKEFQEDAVAKLVRHMRAASKDSKAGDRGHDHGHGRSR